MQYIKLAVYPLLGYAVLVVSVFSGLFIAGLLGRAEITLPGVLAQAVRQAMRPLFGLVAVEGITAGYCTAFLIPDPPEDLRVHEAMHRQQALREAIRFANSSNPGFGWRLIGALWFGALYAVEYIRHGYRANAFEAEARRAAGEE